MARLPRLTLPDVPYHVTQRGNRRQAVFFQPSDRQFYLNLLRTYARQERLEVWAYCLMTNHVHLVVVPRQDGALTRTLAATHWHYTRHINTREDWQGYLWQGRFRSVALDAPHLVAAIRYIERNPVAAGLVRHAAAYPWSSARAHVTGAPDPMLTRCFIQDEIQDWAAFLAHPADDAFEHELGRCSTGRPLGGEDFLTALEQRTGRRLRRARPGPRRPESN